MKNEQLAMLLHDGELGEQERATAEGLMASEPRMLAALEALRLTSSLVREIELERQNAAPDLADDVMAALSLPSSARPPGSSTSEPVLHGLPTRGRPASTQRLGVPVAIAALGLSLAAGALLWLRSPANLPEPVARLSSASSTALVASGASFAAVEPHGPGVSLESVDFGTTRGAIFLMNEGASETMVVWTMDDAAVPTRGVDL